LGSFIPACNRPHADVEARGHQISPRDCEILATIIASWPGEWTAEFEQDYTGGTSAVLLPQHDDEPSFLLYREGAVIRVSACFEDRPTLLGVFVSLSAATDCIRASPRFGIRRTLCH
jgi:hypothetical protein